MLSGDKLPGYRFPLAVIGSAVWGVQRFTLSYRDVEELLLERGTVVTRESIRRWYTTFSDLFAHGLRHRDEMSVNVRLWHAVDEHGAVLDVLLQKHRDIQAARSFFQRRLGEYDVPEVIYTDMEVWGGHPGTSCAPRRAARPGGVYRSL